CRRDSPPQSSEAAVQVVRLRPRCTFERDLRRPRCSSTTNPRPRIDALDPFAGDDIAVDEIGIQSRHGTVSLQASVTDARIGRNPLILSHRDGCRRTAEAVLLQFENRIRCGHIEQPSSFLEAKVAASVLLTDNTHYLCPFRSVSMDEGSQGVIRISR